MEIKWIAAALSALLLSAAVGFGSSYRTGIQPGYFEKQEAPAYGVSEDKPMGSDFGKEYENYFKKLYQEEK
ncbi:MAG TPA: hypothetical protein VF888_00115 [Nitrospirota bacterium]|jgi:hypothetical protein